MELLRHLRRVFAYDEWANREALAALRASPTAAPLTEPRTEAKEILRQLVGE